MLRIPYNQSTVVDESCSHRLRDPWPVQSTHRGPDLTCQFVDETEYEMMATQPLSNNLTSLQLPRSRCRHPRLTAAPTGVRTAHRQKVQDSLGVSKDHDRAQLTSGLPRVCVYSLDFGPIPRHSTQCPSMEPVYPTHRHGWCRDLRDALFLIAIACTCSANRRPHGEAVMAQTACDEGPTTCQAQYAATHLGSR